MEARGAAYANLGMGELRARWGMDPLKVGIAGVRGVVGETLTPEVVVDFAEAFAAYLDGGRVLVCRDPRPSGPMLQAAATAGLLAAGCEVVDLGICPTPSLQLAVSWLGARGGISITGGHNPIGWNALKFVREDGLYLTSVQAEELLDVYHQGQAPRATWDRIPPRVERRDAIDHHLETLSRSFDTEAVRARRLRVAVDCCNGSCAALSPRWLAALGCETLAINDDPTQPFPHVPEPSVAAAAQVRALVRAGSADLGLLHDADGERLSLVDETGRPLSEELTLALAALVALRRRAGPVVTNVSTSSLVDRVAAWHGVAVVRTPVGQAFISEAILEHRAVIGGEGNGAVAVPEVQATHDSAAAIGLLLEHLATTGATLSSLVAELPKLTLQKETLPVAPSLIYSVLQEFREAVGDVPDASVDHTDGVRIAWPDGWVHVRASNTQSLVRLIAEAESPDRCRELLDWARERLRA
jgi:phosphomannomutase